MVYVDYGDQITYESHTLLYKEPKPRIVYLKPGYYIFECWGAQGGTVKNVDGGKGGYTAGKLHITSTQTIYAYIGQKGTSFPNQDLFVTMVEDVQLVVGVEEVAHQ